MFTYISFFPTLAVVCSRFPVVGAVTAILMDPMQVPHDIPRRGPARILSWDIAHASRHEQLRAAAFVRVVKPRRADYGRRQRPSNAANVIIWRTGARRFVLFVPVPGHLSDMLQYRADDHENEGCASAAKLCLLEPLQDNVAQHGGYNKRHGAKCSRWTNAVWKNCQWNGDRGGRLDGAVREEGAWG
ncbi:hypothetical protein V8E53_008063 [Lactarius tabidus]